MTSKPSASGPAVSEKIGYESLPEFSKYLINEINEWQTKRDNWQDGSQLFEMYALVVRELRKASEKFLSLSITPSAASEQQIERDIETILLMGRPFKIKDTYPEKKAKEIVAYFTGRRAQGTEREIELRKEIVKAIDFGIDLGKNVAFRSVRHEKAAYLDSLSSKDSQTAQGKGWLLPESKEILRDYIKELNNKITSLEQQIQETKNVKP